MATTSLWLSSRSEVEQNLMTRSTCLECKGTCTFLPYCEGMNYRKSDFQGLNEHFDSLTVLLKICSSCYKPTARCTWSCTNVPQWLLGLSKNIK